MELVQDLYLRDPFDPRRFSHAQTGPETTYMVVLDTASKVHVQQTNDVTDENLLYWVRVKVILQKSELD